jgi:hypothetical protein
MTSQEGARMLKAGNFLVDALHDCVEVHGVDSSKPILAGALKNQINTWGSGGEQ